MFPIVLATLLAVATPGPAPTASPKPDVTAAPAFAVDPSWIPMPLQDAQYAAYARPKPGAPADLLTANRRKCDCQTADFVTMMQTALKRDNATVTDTTVQLCGQAARHVVSSDLADGVTRRNIDAYVFRQGDYFYALELAFSAKQPTPADDMSLTALCPPAA